MQACIKDSCFMLFHFNGLQRSLKQVENTKEHDFPLFSLIFKRARKKTGMARPTNELCQGCILMGCAQGVAPSNPVGKTRKPVVVVNG